MLDNRNFIVAIVLSIAVLFVWQYFVAGPQIEQARQQQEAALRQTPEAAPATGQQPAAPPAAGVSAATVPAVAVATADLDRADALALAPRVTIANGRVSGSISLVGARIDDLHLNDFHETVDPASPTIVLLSPAGTPDAYFAEHTWQGPAEAGPMPGPETAWSAPPGARLTPTTPVTLTFDNGDGLVFARTVAIDDAYMFTVTDSVANTGSAPVSLTPVGRVTRFGKPKVAGYWILHEGLIGVFGDSGLEQIKYSSIEDDQLVEPGTASSGWLGITDKYWATALVPPRGEPFNGRFVYVDGPGRYVAEYTGTPVDVAAGGTYENASMLFAGAKQVALVDGYEANLGIDRFELLIDWGWFYFVTKPMFSVIDWFFRLFGNFGVAILLVTVCVKAVFFPLANKSYKSMSAMKKMQPQMVELRERYKDDKVKQQQALMELYKKEKINPLAGCWPIAIQIPVFFALYKVLFVTIEMRHAPFFGWIQDLAAPDPTSVFNLFGLLPFDPPSLLGVGVWPLIMGVTMFVQMRLNPTPPDPTQRIIFTWMPLLFTFMLAQFPAGLVIYWAWNNTLSVLQQYTIMRRQGVDVDIIGNIADSFRRGPPKPAAAKVTPEKPAASAGDAGTEARADADPVVDEPNEADGADMPGPKRKKVRAKTRTRSKPRRTSAARAKG